MKMSTMTIHLCRLSCLLSHWPQLGQARAGLDAVAYHLGQACLGRAALVHSCGTPAQATPRLPRRERTWPCLLWAHSGQARPGLAAVAYSCGKRGQAVPRVPTSVPWPLGLNFADGVLSHDEARYMELD